jgi:hypothetical protein
MVQSGFTQQHFDLLATYGLQPWNQTAAEQAAKDTLGEAYEATRKWAKLVQEKSFPDGYIDGAKHVIVRGHHFSPYTWWRIYPRKEAPNELAYTVGIDREGEFIVKIDTNKVGPAIRARYDAECGSTYRKSPFWSVLPAQQGLQMSQEALVDWSIGAIDGFTPNYDELYKRITNVPRLTRVSDPTEESRYFQKWLRCLLETASPSQTGFVVSGTELVVAAPSSESRVAAKLKLSDSGSWVVEVNQTKATSPSTSLSVIGKDSEGHAYLLRRGQLQSNGSDNSVNERQFSVRSGLPSVALQDASNAIPDGEWYVVAALSEDPPIIAAMTSQFVRACAATRLGKSDGGKPPIPTFMVKSTENGGTYVVTAKAAQPEKVVSRVHGEVWQVLSKKLDAFGVKIAKYRHPLGYEIDGAFRSLDGRQILVEIKTDCSAGSIHAAAGQLHLYPALMPELAEADRLLLLPSLPTAQIIDALKKLGIGVHTYERQPTPGFDYTISEDFFAACVEPKP